MKELLLQLVLESNGRNDPKTKIELNYKLSLHYYTINNYSQAEIYARQAYSLAKTNSITHIPSIDLLILIFNATNNQEQSKIFTSIKNKLME